MQDSEHTLLSTVAHELQNPLAALKGYIELVANLGPLTERQKHFSDRALFAIMEMSELITRLLDMSWLDSGQPLQPENVNLAYLSNALIVNFTERATKNGVNLVLNAERVPSVSGEERRLRQVVNNLIGNAVKYSPNGGEITVRVFAEGGQVVFEVRDHGIGIPPEHLDKIFQRFYRVPQQQEAQQVEGNGLGLAISYEIVEKHGGKLTVESTLGGGSCFSFRLPAVME